MATQADLLAAKREEDIRAARTVLERSGRLGLSYTPSPVDWRDEVLYFLLPDRFSDEVQRPTLTRQHIIELRKRADRPDWNWKAWADAGRRWQGGTIKGIAKRLSYLERLGVTAIWIAPMFKQRARLDSYHGYGVQDFLDIDPRFGTRRDPIDLVAAAHERGLRIILDVIINHTGDNWGYLPPEGTLAQVMNEPPYRQWPDYYGNPNGSDTKGWSLVWRNELQAGFAREGDSIEGPHDAVWPRDLQTPVAYTRAGKGSFDHRDREYLGNRRAEHKRTDFLTLKDLALDGPGVLSLLADCYKYWIAVTDCDGFRIDTVKHMALDETRDFCGAIREFADLLGKRNFLLVGEIAGGDDGQDFVLDNLAVLRRNLSAALDIGTARTTLTDVAKGLVPPRAYLDSFDEASLGFESHRAMGDRHVSILDDHDHVRGDKVRFSSEICDDLPVKDYQVVAATAFQLFALGIPCIYYGTEQAFAGPARSQRSYVVDEGWNGSIETGADRFLREAMFGPEHPRGHHSGDLDSQLTTRDTSLPGFGPFGTAGQEAFDPESPAYVRISALCKARAAHPVLRIGRQYPRQLRPPSTTGAFDWPLAGQLAVWSRLLASEEALVVVNPNPRTAQSGDVVVSSELSGPGTQFEVVANTAEAAAGREPYRGSHPVGAAVPVQGKSSESEPSYVAIRDVGPAEVVVLVKQPRLA